MLPVPLIQLRENEPVQIKKDCWVIESKATILEKVYFDEEITKEEAIRRYCVNEYDDIMDSEVLSIKDVICAD